MHNLYFYNHLMEEIRLAIREHRYSEFKKSKLEGFLSKEDVKRSSEKYKNNEYFSYVRELE